MTDQQTETRTVEAAAEPTQTQDGTKKEEQAKAWDAVVEDFQHLGNSLSAAVKEMWSDERNREQLKQFRTGLEDMVKQVGNTIDEASKSEQANNVRQEVKKAATDVRGLGSKVYTDSKPHLVGLLQNISSGLDNIIQRLEKSDSTVRTETKTTPDTTSATSPAPETPEKDV